MMEWQSGFVEANGIRLHYTRTGAGLLRAKPPVVLAHGFTDSGLCWTPVAAALEADYDLIMVDARGHGQSDAPETGYTLAQMAGDLRGIIAGLGLQRPAVMGHSMGGGTTLALAGLYPDVPGAIILEDAGALSTADFPHRREAGEGPAQSLFARLQHKTRADLIAEIRMEHPDWPEAELGPWADAKLRLNPRAGTFDPTVGVTWQELLPRITCPALLITADLDRGAMVTSQRAAEMQRQLPQLQIAHIPGAGHNVRREQFDRFLEVVRSFLAPWAATYQTTGT
ncbi:MAG: alpha/beta hydrolase [Actinomycetota bacterium]|nr:alpha/beta hydrolase [Actinomycetota bacterium]